MLDYLNELDIKIFRFINGELSNPICNWLMPILTDLNRQPIVLLLCAILIIWLLLKGSKKARVAVIILIITIAITDQLSSQIIKQFFGRLRPCHTLHDVRLLVGCGAGLSFPSSHAVNNFAGALILSYFFQKYKLWFFIYATIIAFSRVYVGVHYPSDVVGGAIIGLILSGFVLLVFIYIERILLSIREKNNL